MHRLLIAVPLCLALSSLRAESNGLGAMIDRYRADLELLGRHYEIAGDSSAASTRHGQLLERWLMQAKALDFGALDLDSQIDAVLLANEIEGSRLQLEERGDLRRELAPWLPFRDVIESLADARVRGEPLVPEKAATALAPIAARITKLQESLKEAKARKSAPKDKPAAKDAASPTPPKANSKPPLALPTPLQALQASETAEALAASLKRWFGNYNGFVPEFAWWVRQPHDATAKAVADYAKYLREEIAGVKRKSGDKDKDKEKGAGEKEEEPAGDDPLLGRAIGAEKLQRHLELEFIPYTPHELIALAEREFAWCEEQMKAAAREMKLGDDWKKALQRVKLQHMRPGEQETLVRSEAKRAAAFVKDRRLVTVPPDCEEWWGTQMLSPSAQRNMPYAAYGGHDILVAYASESMKHEDKLMSMRGNNRPFTRNVVPHELIPGHHLQSYMAARERPYRRIFSTPFFVEGWALYWEMRLFDLKYQATPEERIGALFWRMHRCARILVTLKFHLGEMKPDEMVKFLTDRVGHEKFGATSEVRRFIKGDYAPLYQCGYMLGGLQLIALQRELVGDGRMTEQQFHDAVLRLGPIPVELIRASLLGRPLPPGMKSQWKFAGEIK